jgi:hypothetical protein
MIYTLAINEIDWSSIEEFCDQHIPEGSFLDYKEQFPKSIEKTIAALANTFGGVILIGIETDDSNKPKTPIKGIEFEKGLSEKVISIIFSQITPPFIPEIKICQNLDGKRAIIFIRIQQSDTYHAISGNTEIYLRTNDMNHPEKLATLDEVEWLNNKRNKSIVLKISLIDQSRSRFEIMREFCARDNTEIYRFLGNKINELEISILPVYPMNWYSSPIDLYNLFQKIRVVDNFQTSTYFPPSNSNLTGNEINILQDGIFLIHNDKNRFFYSEINSYGIFYFKQNLNTLNQNNQDFLRMSELVSRIKSSVSFAKLFLNEIRFLGLSEINIRLNNIIGSGLFFENDNQKRLIGFCPDNDFFFNNKILVQDLENQIDFIVNLVSKKICWLFGVYS